MIAVGAARSNFYPASKEGGSARWGSNFSAGADGNFRLWSNSYSNIDLFMSWSKCTNYYIEFYVPTTHFCVEFRLYFVRLNEVRRLNQQSGLRCSCVEWLLEVAGSAHESSTGVVWTGPQYVAMIVSVRHGGSDTNLLWSHANLFKIHLVVNNPSLLVVVSFDENEVTRVFFENWTITLS